MIFDAYAFVEKLESEAGQAANPANPAKQKPETPPRLARLAGLAGRQGQIPENAPSAGTYPYGRSTGGNPRTWTGKIVSLSEWRKLSEWERNGSTGKQWNGLTRQWEAKI
jgi:hypothetical protein